MIDPAKLRAYLIQRMAQWDDSTVAFLRARTFPHPVEDVKLSAYMHLPEERPIPSPQWKARLLVALLPPEI
jgi:hypothetical protein